jgi:GT2 family glycosyltransferase/membrane protein implicated in regulation of membrane protease activity
VLIVDLEAPLADLRLPPGRLGPYRSLLVVARVDGDPLGTAALSVNPAGEVPRSRLARGLRRQLEAELREVFARRGLALPPSLPSIGIPGGPGDGHGAAAPRRSVSVVVTTCSDPARLERCVRSILACDHDDFEVIVVENRPRSSTTGMMLAERFASERRLRYVEEPSPGLSQARNTGLALAEGDVVAFTDDDVFVDPAWIRRCARGFERADDVACVTGLIIPLELESDSQLLLDQFVGLGKGFRRQTYRIEADGDGDPLLPYTPGVIGSGANTVVRADVARELGGFDTSLGAGTPALGGEDLDFYVRLLREGHAVAYEPAAIVWHEHPDGEGTLRRQVYRYGVGLGAMLAKRLIAGPKRRELMRAVPAGLRYARDPTSRKNAGKAADYPSRLEWLERLGMLIGPIAYLLSSLVAAIRQPSPPVGRDAVAELTSPARRVLTATAAASCVAAPLVVALGLASVLRFPVVLALLCLGPGTALLTAARGRLELGLVLGVSLGVSAVVAQSMLWFDAWGPNVVLYCLAAVCLAPLVLQLRRVTATPRPFQLTNVRDAIRGVPRFVAAHVVVLTVALALWSASLAGADLGRMSGLGLLNALPAAYFVAFGLLLVGFAMALARDEVPRRLPWLYVLALILVLHGTTAVLYNEPRYAWTYKHLGVIDLIASDRNDLLTRADGRSVEVAGGERVVLQTAGAAVQTDSMGAVTFLLHSLITPDFAFLFFVLGLILIVVELLHPGVSIPGILGVLLLVFSLLSFGMLPVQLAGIVMLLIAVGFFLLELKHPGIGLPAVGGVVFLALGGLFLFDRAVPDVQVSPWLVAVMAAVALLFFGVVVRASLKARRLPPPPGLERLVGSTGVVVTELDPVGVVRVGSEDWSATTRHAPVAAGQRVEVVAVEGLRLGVQPSRPAQTATPARPGPEEGSSR